MVDKLFDARYRVGPRELICRDGRTYPVDSTSLILKIRELPSESSVGIPIELYNGAALFRMGEPEFETAGAFWQDVYQDIARNRRDLWINTLGSMEVFNKYLEQVNIVRQLDKQGRRLDFNEPWIRPKSEDQIKLDHDLSRQRHLAVVGAEKIYWFDRFERLVADIIRTRPDCLILDEDYWSLLQARPELLADANIPTREFIHVLRGNPDQPRDIHNIATMVERRFHAAHDGRVLPNETPRFIGYYLDSSGAYVPAAGLFEVYQNEDGWRVEDTLGTADLSDLTIVNGQISFVKHYRRGVSNPDAMRLPIIYSGQFKGDHFAGNYGVVDADEINLRDVFKIWEYSPDLNIHQMDWEEQPLRENLNNYYNETDLEGFDEISDH